jgi:hypothetical protein
MPHVIDVDVLFGALQELSGGDIKSLRTVRPQFIDALKRLPIFNICFVLNRDRRLDANERVYFQRKIAALRRQLDIWDKTTPEGRGFTSGTLRRMARFEQEVASKNPNLKLLRDIEIVSTIAAYLASTLSARKDEVVTWFSDRDSMLTFLSSGDGSAMAFDLAFALHHVLCFDQDGDGPGKLAFGSPEATGSMFYDALVRIPDLMCGALADYNLQTRQTSHAKFTPVLQQLFTEHGRNTFYKLELTKVRVGLSQLQFTIGPPESDSGGEATDPSDPDVPA